MRFETLSANGSEVPGAMQNFVSHPASTPGKVPNGERDKLSVNQMVDQLPEVD